MFETWDAWDWAILVVDIVAIAIVATFLKRKIQHKIAEVEARQAHHLRMKKTVSSRADSDQPGKETG